MAKVINSTVWIAKEEGGIQEQVPAGTELSGDYAWVTKVLKDHGTYDTLVEDDKAKKDAPETEESGQ